MFQADIQKQVVKIVFLCFICKISFCEHNGNSDFKGERKYEFELFEDFLRSADTYKQERILIREIKSIKEELHEIHHNMAMLKKMKLSKRINEAKNLAVRGNQLQMKSLAFAKNIIKHLPRRTDYIASIKALLMLYQSYGFNIPYSVEKGKLMYTNHMGLSKDYQCYEKLMFADVIQIATYAMKFGNYATSIELVKQLLEILPHQSLSYEEQDKLTEQVEELRSSLVQLNNGYLQKTKRFLGSKHISLPYLVSKNLSKKSVQPSFVQNGKVSNFSNNVKSYLEEWKFTKICKNGKWKESASALTANKKSQCRYLHHLNPYLMLGPFKEDHLSSKPYIVVFRDFLSNNEIDELIEKSKPKLSEKRMFDLTGDMNSGKYNIKVHKSVQAWLEDVKWPPVMEKYVGNFHQGIVNSIIYRLGKKIFLATQLITSTQTSGSKIQVTNYGLGGLCEPHIDPHGIMESDELHYRKVMPRLYVHGDILGTFMAWLNDVDDGGGTAFLGSETQGLIMPEKGSAAFWYNLVSDGLRDQLTNHAGCPVLHGSKWIMNKWMYWYDNYKMFPCHLGHGKPFAVPDKQKYF